MSTDNTTNSEPEAHSVPELATYAVPLQVTVKATDAAAAEQLVHHGFAALVTDTQGAELFLSAATTGRAERVDG